ncbi:hypothetical protein K227x_51250 [Rubripirellula lacrimiformis]|uniref:PEP-CTERM protein-sorting domain-containing protein n=1 Tax=Rubripirellula lacrimiformis TaxID=1930273 RepID=A0A517NHU9_9BACT|nr:hypothetical protein [Rubripirellula lacrimiformis]QDT06709.1 hypothetical protein K227x_51250 [Rubripirellula lacrimiformis]
MSFHAFCPRHRLFQWMIVSSGFLIGGIPIASADWRDDVGFTQLATELGAATPTGAGVDVAMAEALVGGNYLPNTGTPNFSGKTITDLTGTNPAASTHATGVANFFFGNTTSIAPGVTNIAAYDANDWIDVASGLSTVTAPVAHPYSVMNHSYIGNVTAAEIPLAENFSQRVDYIVNRDNVLMVAGSNNGNSTTLPHLLAGSYNAIIVGRSDGNHAHGTTVINGAGRQRPDIVSPASVTSTATPQVSSAAALLHEAAAGTNATNVEAMRAILMAGATKDEFFDWDRTTTRPIDDVYGAGELNVYNSYRIVQGGEFEGSIAIPTTSVGLFGYDFNSPADFASDFLYDFEVASGQVMDELSIFLQWNIDVGDSDLSDDGFQPSLDPLFGGGLADLNLALFDSSGSLIDQSISSVDNFEHIYLTGLTEGNYRLHVSGDRAVDYGLAWRGSLGVTAVPEPTTWFVAAVAITGVALRRRAPKRRPAS